MKAPTVNNNGTAVRDLLKQHENVLHKLSELMSALEEATPHGRDFIGAEDNYAENRKEAEDLYRLLSLKKQAYTEVYFQLYDIAEARNEV